VDFTITLVTFFTKATSWEGWPEIVAIGLFMIMAVAAVVALVSQERSDLWPGIRRLTWAGLGYMAGALAAGTVLLVVIAGRGGVVAFDSARTCLLPTETMEGFVLGIVSAVATGFIGGIGLWRTLQYRRQAKPRKGPPVPPPLPPPARDASGDALPSPDEVSA
jgi:hypothetical protein